MTDGFEENVPEKLPATKQCRQPVRPWDVQPDSLEEEKPTAGKTATDSGNRAAAVADAPPLLSITETKEPSRKMVREILRELTEKEKGQKGVTEPPPPPSTPMPPEPGEEVLVASDNSMLIEQESNEVLEEIENLEAELDSALNVQHKMEEDLFRVREEYDELLHAKEELEAQVETLKTIEELESNLKASEEENKLALGKVKELETGLEKSFQQQKQVRAELDATCSSLAEMTELRDAVSHHLESEKTKGAALDRKIGEMTEDRRRLRENVAALETACEDLKSEIIEHETKGKDLEQKLSRTEGGLEEEKQKTKYLETQVENYAVVKATLESDLNAARTALKSIRNRLSAATSLMRKKPLSE